jgi:radical SAM enzyme (TIGR01210 family)
VSPFRTVIVENHPKLCGASCIEFRDLLHGASKLEIAFGLETVHEDVLARLNKQMTLNDFREAAQFLETNEIALRAFILLKPPYIEERDSVDWALRSIEFAFDCGARVCSVIPTRSGNGMLERLEREGAFAPPRLESLESVLERGLALGRGRVLVDLWDIERFSSCRRCASSRTVRLRKMNLLQKVLPAIECDCT